ncbi:MAG: hypothetical protein J0L78_11595 [Planctomycetes bacterium]|nr:hypothetical protein [Planctomycetota bacterium]
MLILLGLRTSGKTTLGAIAARFLSTTFLDLDLLTAKVLNQPTAGDAIRNLGLGAFRAGEVRALDSQEARGAGVLSLGGGTPTDPHARESLKAMQNAGSRIVYLRATPETLKARMAKTDLATRPSLTGKSPIDEVDQIFAERDPIFRSVADITIDVDAMTERIALASVLATLG